MRPSRLLTVSAGLAAALAACQTPEAPADAAPGDRPVVLIVTAREEADAATAAAAVAIAGRLAATVSGFDLLSGGQLGRRLERDPEAAISGCGANLGCIAGLAREAGGREVVFGRVRSHDGTGSGGGATLQFLTLATDREQVTRPVELEIASMGQLEARLRERFTDIFGVPLPVETPLEAGPADEAVLARCTVARGDVQVRRTSTLRWEPLRDDGALAAGDLVRTAPGATAEITYRTGATVDLAPGTLIVIEASAPAAAGGGAVERISVRSGAVRGTMAAEGQAIVVRAPDGEETRLAAAAGSGPVAYRVLVRKDESMEVAIREGRGELTTAQGDRIELASGKAQDLRFGALAGGAVSLPDFPRLLAPGVDAPVVNTKDLVVTLRWKEVERASTYRLQIARDQSFRQLVVDKTCAAPSYDFEPPTDGTYSWRVATRDELGREGEFGFSWRLFVTPERIADLLVSPTDGATVNAGREYMGFITFSWRAAVPPAPYVLYVSTERDVLQGEPALNVTTTAQEVMTRQLDPGNYYWGVFVKRGDELKPIFTKPRNLVVSAGQ